MKFSKDKTEAAPVEVHVMSKEAAEAIEKMNSTGQYDALVPEADIALVVTAASTHRRSLSVHPAEKGVHRIVVQGRM